MFSPSSHPVEEPSDTLTVITVLHSDTLGVKGSTVRGASINSPEEQTQVADRLFVSENRKWFILHFPGSKHTHVVSQAAGVRGQGSGSFQSFVQCLPGHE